MLISKPKFCPTMNLALPKTSLNLSKTSFNETPFSVAKSVEIP